MNGQEIYDRLKSCIDAGQVKSLATEAGISITDEQAAALMAANGTTSINGALDDSQLGHVVGGFNPMAIPEMISGGAQDLQHLDGEAFFSKLIHFLF